MFLIPFAFLVGFPFIEDKFIPKYPERDTHVNIGPDRRVLRSQASLLMDSLGPITVIGRCRNSFLLKDNFVLVP
jgi:hypothetical protein